MDAHLRIKFVPAGQLADKLSEGVHVQVLYMYNMAISMAIRPRGTPTSRPTLPSV
jgi:hypothetical protein